MNKLIFEFGGQGIEYIEELKSLYHTHAFLQTWFIEIDEMLKRESNEKEAQLSKGWNGTFDIMHWINTQSNERNWENAYFSYPLIGFVQILNYVLFLKEKGKKHQEMLEIANAAIGHSQGMNMAVVMSWAKNDRELKMKSKRMIQYLYWHGLRVQETMFLKKCMLSVRNVSKVQMEKLIRHFDSEDLHLALVNGDRSFCVAGRHLEKFQGFVKNKAAKSDQTRIPYSKRKMEPILEYVQVTSPFHSAHLRNAKEIIMQDIQRIQFKVEGLSIPVYATTDKAQDLKVLAETQDILPFMVEMQVESCANWTSTCAKVLSTVQDGCIVDFGPKNGALPLTSKLLAGSRMQWMSSRDAVSDTWKKNLHKIGYAQECTPMVKNGKLVNKFTRCFGKPPIMVGGMTPTTSWNGIDLIAAGMNAGYHMELAAGGLPRAEIFESKIMELLRKIQPGQGITINMLYLNAKQWGFQFPLVLSLRAQGVPIESITIAAGIPTPEKAISIMERLGDVGIVKVGFKPGSLQAIKQVIAIAKTAPWATIILQWTGGRAGGHHSFEDFHRPLLEAYSFIRKQNNIVLVVGSGFGDAQGSLPYLSGEWSYKYGKLVPYPVDAILLASRVMVAKEAATANEVKQLLVEASGITTDDKWEMSYDSSAGGVLSVLSELGEPIHMIENRATRCWRDFERKYFALPKEQLIAALRRDKASIVHRLNSDYQKPFFASTLQKRIVELHEMTFYEVIQRMRHLMMANGYWIHTSYQEKYDAFLNFTRKRFCIPDDMDWQTAPKIYSTTLGVRDVDQFVKICKVGGKPVNFIPVLDEDFMYYFKKDSLWYSENLDAVPNRDAERVCILHGPMSLSYSIIANEPIATILGSINDIYVETFQSSTSEIDGSNQFEGFPKPRMEKGSVLSIVCPSEFQYESDSQWYSYLASFCCSTIATFLESNVVVNGKKWERNKILKLMLPRNGCVFRIDSRIILDVYVHDNLTLSIKQVKENDVVTTMMHTLPQSEKQIELTQHYSRSIFAQASLNISNIRKFYSQLWLCGENSISDSFTSSEIVSINGIRKYYDALQVEHLMPYASIDYATVLGWKAIIGTVFCREINANLLHLVHLSHSYQSLQESDIQFCHGDRISATCIVSGFHKLENGIKVSGSAIILQNDTNPIVVINSEFFIRGQIDAIEFQSIEVHNTTSILNMKDLHVLSCQSWFKLIGGNFKVGQTLIFDLKCQYSNWSGKCVRNILGIVYVVKDGRKSPLGYAHVTDAESHFNDILGYFNHEKVKDIVIPLASSYNVLSTPVEIDVPTDAMAYAAASGDYNSIHYSKDSAIFAGLPKGKPIMHGMWVSSKIRHLLGKVQYYKSNFEAMVLPGDQLYVQFQHTDMIQGLKVYHIECVNANGVKVLSGIAHVPQLPTAYVFTGQGSAVVGMGMSTFETDKKVWIRGDTQLRKKYGFSILEIVRNNPKTLTIHFGGRRGREIRENYMQMFCEHPITGAKTPLLPEISISTEKFTFQAPQGLLFATQFSQPALILFESAAFARVQQSGILPPNTCFAGHSLGEYAGLSAFAQALTIESVVEIVFLRGLIMQKAVARDEFGRSNYGMVAINPIRVPMQVKDLFNVVDEIAQQSKELLEIVNYNVHGLQYVAAGTLRNLHVLSDVLSNGFLSNNISSQVTKNLQSCSSKPVLTKGRATIPLSGIDVPFHSKELLRGVPSFRKLLTPQVDEQLLDDKFHLLEGKYIPNLTATPFSISKDYFEFVLNLTNSPILSHFLDKRFEFASRATKLKTLVVELLAYQFASPVQWIRTQEVLVHRANRIIEIGPSPTLTNMFKKGNASITAYWYDRSRSQIHFEDAENACSAKEFVLNKFLEEDVDGEADVDGEEDEPCEEIPPLVLDAASISVPQVEDQVTNCKHAFYVFTSCKLDIKFEDVKDTSTIKGLCGGKSAVQNEFVGDLEQEFKLPTEDVTEVPLQELSLKIQGSYTIGKSMYSLITTLYRTKMPGGFGLSKVKEYLKSTRHLPSGIIENVLVHSLTHEPAARLSGQSDAITWLNTVVDQYASYCGIQIPHPNTVARQQSKQEFSELNGDLMVYLSKQADLTKDFLKSTEVVDIRQALKENQFILKAAETNIFEWKSELGMRFLNGILPMFDVRKLRIYDSFWNWVVQDGLDLYFRTIRNTTHSTSQNNLDKYYQQMTPWLNLDIMEMSNTTPPMVWSKPFLCNRATPELLTMTKYFAYKSEQNGLHDVSQAVQLLVEQVEFWLDKDPVSIPTFESQCPILENNSIYKEIPRNNVASPADYVTEMSRDLKYQHILNTSIEFAWSDDEQQLAIKHDKAMLSLQGLEFPTHFQAVIPSNETRDKSPPKCHVQGPKLTALRKTLYASHKSNMERCLHDVTLPFTHIRRLSTSDPTIRIYDEQHTSMLLATMDKICSEGISFCNKTALLTGCGLNSIGLELLKALLEGGCKVYVTTSTFNDGKAQMYEKIYKQFGSRGSALIVVPMNQGSLQDIKSTIDHIYKHSDIDIFVPFAAIPQGSQDISNLDSVSELALRVMMTNTIRMIGEISNHKLKQQSLTRPCVVLLPLSPNHGVFGSDGTYAESKLGLESLFQKWYSEELQDTILLAGAVIGWTRGTGLMSTNNLVAPGIESCNVRTFSTEEMAFNLLTLLHSNMVDLLVDEPIYADFSGGMSQLYGLGDTISNIRKSLDAPSTLFPQVPKPADLGRYFNSSFPTLPEQFEVSKIAGMHDLERVVVITGFGEVSPWGNAHTRWEMEAYGEFSLEGCIELAWLTGRIKYSPSNGLWVNVANGESLEDHQVKSTFEQDMLSHSGIRIIEPELFDGYDPHEKLVYHQVALDSKMEAIEVADEEEALEFKVKLGSNVEIYKSSVGVWMVQPLQGATVAIPKALKFDRFVAGQIPSGWNAERLGIPKEIANSVDPVTLYSLVSTAEALISSGVCDPYEFYEYVHVSAVGNTSGGGLGGMRGLKRIYGERKLGRVLPNDSLQECFINSMPAWVNMLLLSSSGPIKTPVGACATAAESIDVAMDTILNGKARMVVVGGYDDFGEEGSFEFAQMGATSNAQAEMAMGRSPRTMCRPCTTTRGGFMESQGSGTQILMDAKLAIEMGCPIYAIVAASNTATDKNGRSVPAPGQGILTSARESNSIHDDDGTIDLASRIAAFHAQVNALPLCSVSERSRRIKQLQALYGGEFYKHYDSISPIRGALEAWDLTIDDIGVASFHGTGTTANDKNESEVTQKQMMHLGRSSGNPLPVICQKHLTGHPKGAAAAWMVNGLLQVLQTGIIPGNTNNDNTCSSLRQYKFLTYPSRSIQTTGIQAGLLKSFGFGQASGEVLLLHPHVLLKTLPFEEYHTYRIKSIARCHKASIYHQRSLTSKHSFVQVKQAAPYANDDMTQVYLDPTARATFDAYLNTWTFTKPKRSSPISKVRLPKSPESTSISTILDVNTQGIGIDVEPISSFDNIESRYYFLERNFTKSEMDYCMQAPSPSCSFAGKWAAKEAILKAISSFQPQMNNPWSNASSALIDIEIIHMPSGAPSAVLHHRARDIQSQFHVKHIKLSISHTSTMAVAQAIVS